jgi:poly-gamma-glutamate synthesis protein (capsule biosynthesis protein)
MRCTKLLAILIVGVSFSFSGRGPALSDQKAREDGVLLFLCGDVMTGRGVDQVLPHPGDPRLHEPHLQTAQAYVALAEKANGPIEKPVSFSYIWGDALDELRRRAPDVRIINLETSITASSEHWQSKGIHYRMHPGNIACLSEAGVQVCALANNHVLDWGYAGLVETVDTLRAAGLQGAGAGRNLRDAAAPAVVDVPTKGRVLVFSYGLTTSGIPSNWAASDTRPGVNLLPDMSDASVRRVRKQVLRVKQPGDVVVASIHWGSNWGYDIPEDQREFAHRLVDEAHVDVVHGHSSHHVKALEVYRDKLILYGCGDFLNDYEGIGGHEAYRADLALMYFARVNPSTGKLLRLQMVPMQVRRFRANRAFREDVLWLRDLLNRVSKRFGTRVDLSQDNALILCRD